MAIGALAGRPPALRKPIRRIADSIVFAHAIVAAAAIVVNPALLVERPSYIRDAKRVSEAIQRVQLLKLAAVVAATSPGVAEGVEYKDFLYNILTSVSSGTKHNQIISFTRS